MKRVKPLRRGDLLFFLSIGVALSFVLTPFLMRWNIISEGASSALKPLKIVDYKSSYFEMLGAMLGSFLAITGALWVQNIKEYTDKMNIVKESALIVYYDFEFSFEELKPFLEALASIRPGVDNEYDDVEFFIRYRRSVQNMYLDADWIKNVAKLHEILDKKTIKYIYNIYGVLTTIKKALDMNESEIDKKTVRDVHRLLYTEIFDLTIGSTIEVQLKSDSVALLVKLENLLDK